MVLDDDPTGTQSAAGVLVLLDLDERALDAYFASHPPGPVYVLTNSRALSPERAEQLVAGVSLVARRRWPRARFVLRGDSTLRGHVRPEYLGLAGSRPLPALFVPAMPEAGRITLDGHHYLARGGEREPLEATEYARDPDFAYSSADVLDWAEERTGGLLRAAAGRRVVLGDLRRLGPEVVRDAARTNRPAGGRVGGRDR